MTAKRTGNQRRTESIERDIRRLSAKIHEFESILLNKDHPVLTPFIEKLKLREENVNKDLDDFEEKSEMQIKLLLKERQLVRSLTAFDDIEGSLPYLREKLTMLKKELERETAGAR